MPTVVIVPPSPFMTPADIPGTHAPNDAVVAAYIAAAAEQIDGPGGWVGRAFGVQTLEEQRDGFGCGLIELPCPPVVSLTSITYIDASGAERSIDISGIVLDQLNGTLRLSSGSWPATGCHAGGVRIRYVAGYNAVAVNAGGTGSIPARVKQAVAFKVQNTMFAATAQQDLKVIDIDGVERLEYFTSRADSATLVKSANALLAELRVFR